MDFAKIVGVLVFISFVALAFMMSKPMLGINQLISSMKGSIFMEPHIFVYSNHSISHTINLTIANSFDFYVTIYNVSGKYFKLTNQVTIMPGSTTTVAVDVINREAAYECLNAGNCTMSIMMGFLGVNLTEIVNMSLK